MSTIADHLKYPVSVKRPATPLPEAPDVVRLPEHRQKQVEAGLATFQSVITERDALEQKLREATLTIDGMRVQLNSLQGVINMMESTYLSAKLDLEKRVQQHQEERDHAVTHAASLETILSSIQTLIFSKMPTHHDAS